MSLLRSVFALLLGLAMFVAGCRGTRSVTVQGEAPPPTVVTKSDTTFLASPPDTLFPPLPAPERVVTRTVPVEVIKYVDARPDTARAFLLWSLAIDSARVEVAGAASDASYRRPAPGEVLRCVADGPSLLSCRVEGTPAKPKPVRFECPEPPDALFRANLVGWATFLAAMAVACGLGLFAGRVLG